MNSRVKIRVLRPFWLGGAPAEPGTVIEVDPLTAWGLAPSQAEILHPERARPLIAAAVTESNVQALQIEKQGQPRGTAVSAWVLPSAAGYRPHVH